MLNLPTGDQVRGLVFHPHDRRLAVACGAAVRLFDSATGLELSRLEFPGSEEGVNSVAWRPDGRVLAAGCDDRKIHLLDVEAQKEYSSPLMHADYGLKVAFDRTGERLFSTGTDGRTLVWDATNGRLELRTSRVMQIHASADNRWFAFDTRDGLVRLWTLTSGKELRIMRPLNAGADANYLVSALHRDGRVLAASSYRRLHFFDLETGQQLAEMSFTDGRNASILGCDPTGAWLTGGTSGLLKWPVQTREDDPETLQIGPPQILARGFNSDASWGAGVSSDGRLIAVPDFSYCTVIEQGREAPLFRLGEQTDMRACAISDDWVITCSHWSNGTTSGAQVWSARDGAHVRYLPLKAYVQAKFSPDGKWLATSSPEEGGAPVTRLWDTNNWRERLKFESRSIAFSPDSRVLAVADERGAIRLVDMHSGREFGWLNAPEAQSVVLAGFTPDASKLIAANAKWEILVWDLRAVRSQLKAEGLDWEWPDQPPRTPPPLLKAIEVVTGDLGAARLSPDEQAARDIETYRQRHAANPAGALQCNNLAWAYVMAPEPMREVARAVELAETAVRGQPNEPMFVNTLGASYYRANRFAEAIAVLRPNLEKQADDGLAFDLFFLAMSCQRLGDVERAHDYYRWAMRWMRSRPNESAPYNAELAQLKTETEKLLENSGK